MIAVWLFVILVVWVGVVLALAGLMGWVSAATGPDRPVLLDLEERDR